MRDLATVPAQVSTVIAKDISREIQRNFDVGRDAFRKRWKPLAKSTLARGRHPPPLTDSGRGRASVSVTPRAGAGITITIGILYMVYHQNGGDPGPPRRAFIPVTVLPEAWAEIIMFRIEERAGEMLKRGY